MGDRENERKRRLAEYFKNNLKKGYTMESLKWALVNQGYSRTFIEEAMRDATKQLASEAPILKEKPTITHEIIDENFQAVPVKASWWRRLLGLD
ncbi:MAG: hypothetical protein AABW63_03175 [Nanoarchaeota archaeon]